MDALEKWMLIRFTQYQTTTLYTKMDVFPKPFVRIILAPKWLVWHSSIRPPVNGDDLCHIFCLDPTSMGGG